MLHLLTNRDLPYGTTQDVLRTASNSARSVPPVLSGKNAVLLFDKPSTRTRFSFERALGELGCSHSYADWSTTNFAKAHAIDEVRVLSGYADLLVVRLSDHALLSEMAAASSVPVINGMTDWTHPCQALADIVTIRQKVPGELPNLTVAYAGDLTNVFRSLVETCMLLGAKVKAAIPESERSDDSILSAARAAGALEMTGDVYEAVADADVVYTDSWVSLGREADRARRLEVFGSFSITLAVFNEAREHAIFLHCLPAERGLEVSSEVFDHPKSMVFAQAHNRYTTAKALLYHMFKRS